MRYLLAIILLFPSLVFAVPSVPIDNILMIRAGAFEASTLDKKKSSAVAYRYSPDGKFVLYKNSNMTFEDWCKAVFKNYQNKAELVAYYKSLPIKMLTRQEARAVAQSWQPTENIDVE